MIYWDHNAGAPLRPEVAKVLGQGLGAGAVGNPSSVHRAGRAARQRLEDARARIARALGRSAKEICFVASGSEADALALIGAFLARKDPARTRVVTSAIEHPALLGAAEQLRRQGAQVTVVPPESSGRVDAERFVAELKEDVALCSLMWANNETGVLQPIEEVSVASRRLGITFHTDAVQALGRVPVTGLGAADLAAISSHKLGGPPGAGVLVIDRGREVLPLVPGHQEWGRRGGTQNVPYADALATAVDLAVAEQPTTAAQVSSLRDRFEAAVLENVPGVTVHGQRAPRLPNTSHLGFTGVDGEALLIALDLEGICASSGAACASGTLKPSHVLLAMGLSAAQAQGSLRFSLGRETTQAEVDRVVEALAVHAPRCRDGA